MTAMTMTNTNAAFSQGSTESRRRARLALLRPGLVLVLAAATLGGCSGPSTGREKLASGGIQVAISGEDTARSGILFPDGSDVRFVDGWEVTFTHVLVTVGEVLLSSNPDRAPSDPSQTGGVVARAPGPWAVDLHRPGHVPDASGSGFAIPLAMIESQTENGGEPFVRDERYAFSYEIAPATSDAEIVNFAGDDEAEAAYSEMIESGASVMYLGTATFKGESCASSNDSYDFSRLPSEVPFRLAFRTPTRFINCQNERNQGDPFDGEVFQRGLAITQNAATLAQITLHLEHPFFSAALHDPSLYFGQMAAQMANEPPSTTLTLEDLAGLDPTAITDGDGEPLPFRSCDESPLPPGQQFRVEAGSVPIDPAARPGAALRDYLDFVQYVQSTQGHLNGGEGLCFVERLYPSPP